MKSKTRRTVTGFAGVISILVIISAAVFSAAAQEMKEAHKVVVSKWLKANTSWRLAVDADFDFGEEAKDQFGPEFLPYYLSHDLNRDGEEDFAVILVGEKENRKRGIAVFLGPFEGRSLTKPAFFSDELEDGDGLMMVYPAEVGSERIMVGPFESDNLLILTFEKGKFWLLPMEIG